MEINLSNISLRWLLYHSKLSKSRQDCIILGASKLEHFENNIKPFVYYKNSILNNIDNTVDSTSSNMDGPLPQSVVDAYDKAWELINQAGVCPPYQRGVSKW